MVKCPHCGNAKVYYLVKSHNLQCKECDTDVYRFSVIAVTSFENANKSLKDWFRIIHMLLTAKKGVSAFQVHRAMGFGS